MSKSAARRSVDYGAPGMEEMTTTQGMFSKMGGDRKKTRLTVKAAYKQIKTKKLPSSLTKKS